MNDSSCAFEIICSTMKQAQNKLSVKELCAIAGVSRSGYYAWLKAAPEREKREQQDRNDFDLILSAYKMHGYAKGAKGIYMTLRTLKDSARNYLWKESDETIFSKPVQIVDSMPSIGKGQKVIAFGDFSNYWLVQRFPLTIRTLKEKFAMRGQVGYLGCEYLDGKLIRKDAVKVLQMAAD